MEKTPRWHLVISLCAILALSSDAAAQGIGAAGATRSWYRQAVELRDIALAVSLEGRVANMLQMLEGTESANLLVNFGRENATAGPNELIRKYLRHRDALEAARNLLFEVAAAAPPGQCPCCCEDPRFRAGSKKAAYDPVPLFAIAADLMATATDDFIGNGTTGISFSTTLASAAVGKLVSAILSGSDFANFLAEDFAVDLFIPAAGPGTGTLLTGYSVGIAADTIGSVNYGWEVSGFVRAVPLEMLPEEAFNRAVTSGSTTPHSTFGLRLSLFTMTRNPVGWRPLSSNWVVGAEVTPPVVVATGPAALFKDVLLGDAVERAVGGADWRLSLYLGQWFWRRP